MDSEHSMAKQRRNYWWCLVRQMLTQADPWPMTMSERWQRKMFKRRSPWEVWSGRQWRRLTRVMRAPFARRRITA